MKSQEMTQAEIVETHARIGKLMAETAKINAEARWYPLVIAGGLVAGVITLTKLFL